MKPQPQAPPSLWVSVALSGFICFAFFLIHWLFSKNGLGALEVVLFFFLTFAGLSVALEWIVFRKLKQLNIISQQEIQKLRDLEVYRREFLAEVSHELKTPIFAIQGFIHTLMDGAIYDETVRIKFLKKAMKNSDRLSTLVEDLLIITQAESGEMEIRMRKFGIFDLATEVLENLEYKFTKKGRNISHQIIANGLEEVLVMADRERIQQVLTNLVDNAIKYGHVEGKVVIELARKGTKVWITVIDNGPGIAPEHLDKIFRRFYRVDKSRSREKGGTGLGLSICKHLLEAHGETIHVTSDLGVGTRFSFSLTISEA